MTLVPILFLLSNLCNLRNLRINKTKEEFVRMKLGIFLLTAIAICAGCNNSSSNSPTVNSSTPVTKATATPDEFSFARANFAKHCVECHGADGAGGTVTVDGKKLKVPSLTEGHALKHTDKDDEEQIVEGGDGMPPFKDKFSQDEISALVKFIRKEIQKR
jgi:mono/diheme cytochrome c family protein